MAAAVSRLAPVALALVAGCSTVSIVPNPVTLGLEPIEIVFSPPLVAGARTNREISGDLQIDSAADLPASSLPQDGLFYRDGRQVAVRAVLALQGGESVALGGDALGCLSLAGACVLVFTVPRGRLVIEKIQFSASAPLRVKSIQWTEGIPK
jgi:hypothetical protein